MDMIEFSIFTIGIKANGIYGQTLATLFAILVLFLIYKRRT
ncbi:hypothetical protein [Rhizobium halophilum]|nr:hypothetical protein [Rhizobium halophilum]